jgi:hypothetical protein
MYFMARGWESKGVDEQQAEKLAAGSQSQKTQLNAEQMTLTRRMEGLRLQKQNVLKQLEIVKDVRHRAMLEATLADLNGRLEEFNS